MIMFIIIYYFYVSVNAHFNENLTTRHILQDFNAPFINARQTAHFRSARAHVVHATMCPHGKNTTSASLSIQILHCSWDFSSSFSRTISSVASLDWLFIESGLLVWRMLVGISETSDFLWSSVFTVWFSFAIVLTSLTLKPVSGSPLAPYVVLSSMLTSFLLMTSRMSSHVGNQSACSATGTSPDCQFFIPPPQW